MVRDAIVAAVIRELVSWARRLGRWVLRRLAKRGAKRVIEHLEDKIEDLTEARDNAKSRKTFRPAYWQRRIEWREQLLKWLVARQDKITRKIVEIGTKLLDEGARKIPIYTQEAV